MAAHRARDNSGWGCLLVLVVGLVAALFACPGLALFGGVGGIIRTTSNASEANAQRVAVDYYAAVAAHDWARARAAFEPSPSEAELAALWARREAAGPRVAGFTVATLTLADSSTGTVAGTLRYADGTTSPQTVQVRIVKGGWEMRWGITSPP